MAALTYPPEPMFQTTVPFEKLDLSVYEVDFFPHLRSEKLLSTTDRIEVTFWAIEFIFEFLGHL